MWGSPLRGPEKQACQYPLGVDVADWMLVPEKLLFLPDTLRTIR